MKMPTREDTVVPEHLLTPAQLRKTCERAADGSKYWAVWRATPKMTQWTEDTRVSTKWIATFKGVEFRITKWNDNNYAVLVTSKTANSTIHLYEFDSAGTTLEEAKNKCEDIIYSLHKNGYMYQKIGNECIGIKLYDESHICIICNFDNEDAFEKFLSKLKTKWLWKSEDE